MSLTKVTRNYQVTVPRDIRELAGIKIGDTMIINREKDEIKMTKVTKEAVERAFGSWKTVKNSVEFVKKIRSDSEKRLKRLHL